MANNGHNPYAGLEGEWGWFAKIAEYFVSKVKYEDRQDFRHDLLIEMVKVKEKYKAKDKPLTEAGLMRIGSYVVMSYWRDLMRKPTILSLNGELSDGDGDTAELWATLADDSIDLESWLDAKRWLLGCPKRLIAVAVKLYSGKRLDGKDYDYVERYRQKELRKYQLALT
jgi:hypothetical protein